MMYKETKLITQDGATATVLKRLLMSKATERTRRAYANDLRDFAEFFEIESVDGAHPLTNVPDTMWSELDTAHVAAYLENLSDRLFTHIELWLKTGVIAPKTISLLERLFREIGRRLKKIAWGWSDKIATNLSKMIMIKQYSRQTWEDYWKEKLGIKGYFNIRIQKVYSTPCHNF